MNIIPNRIKYNPKEHPFFFGAYLNLATHNAFIILKYINDTFVGKGDFTKESEMANSYLFEQLKNNTRLNKDQLTSIQTSIKEYFPFVNWTITRKDTTPKNIQEIGEVLNFYISKLMALRNLYSHACNAGKCIDDNKLIDYLSSVFDASRVNIKERFSYHAADLEHLVRLGKHNKERYGFSYSLKEGHKLSDYGLIFFTCLFLRPRDSQLFLKKIKGFKDSRDKISQATIHCFTANGIRLPSIKMKSDNSSQAIVLDTLNELKKCPNQLYKHLTQEKQLTFSPNKLDEEEDSDVLDFELNLLKRYQNRFVHLTLSYLDYTNRFKNLRFQIKYGKFYYRNDLKQVGNEKFYRWLSKNLYAFGKMDEILKFKEKLRAIGLLKKSSMAPNVFLEAYQPEPYINDRNPIFINENHQILFSLEDPKPLKESSIVKMDNIEMYNKPDGFESNNEIFSLSEYDLPGFVFYSTLINNSDKFEGQIKKWRSDFLDFVNDVKTEKIKDLDQAFQKGFTKKNIPQSIYNYLNVDIKKPVSAKKLGVLKKMLAETEALTKKVNNEINQRSKVGERSNKIIESGKLADILARDMVFFIKRRPPLKKIHKPNATQFKQLQKSMAFWGLYADDLDNIMLEMNLKKYHPFYLPVGNLSIDTYFETYFMKKKKYLEECIDKLVKNDKVDLFFIKSKGVKSLEQICEAFENNYLLLPKYFFKDLCREELNDKYKLKIDETKSLSYMYQKYKDKDKDKDKDKTNPSNNTQEYYNFERTYELIDKWQDNRPQEFDELKQVPTSLEERKFILDQIKTWLSNNVGGSKKFKYANEAKPHIAIKKRYKNVLNSEESIRKVAFQDKLLFDLSLDYLKNISELNGLEKSNLKDIDGLLNTPINYTYRYNDKYNIVDDKMKIKDFGKFQRLIRDRRLINLLPYFNSENINRSDILTELENYEKYRIEVCQLIYDFELKMKKKYLNHFETLQKKDNGLIVSHGLYLDKLIEEKIIDESSKETMSILRNKFFHNEYPLKEKVQISCKTGFAEKLFSMTKRYYNEAIS